MKNRELVLFNISEAIDQLQQTMSELKNDAEYSEIELRLDLEHAYHHLNYAWHIRDVPISQAAEPTDELFAKWSKFPVGEILEYE